MSSEECNVRQRPKRTIRPPSYLGFEYILGSEYNNVIIDDEISIVYTQPPNKHAKSKEYVLPNLSDEDLEILELPKMPQPVLRATSNLTIYETYPDTDLPVSSSEATSSNTLILQPMKRSSASASGSNNAIGTTTYDHHPLFNGSSTNSSVLLNSSLTPHHTRPDRLSPPPPEIHSRALQPNRKEDKIFNAPFFSRQPPKQLSQHSPLQHQYSSSSSTAGPNFFLDAAAVANESSSFFAPPHSSSNIQSTPALVTSDTSIMFGEDALQLLPAELDLNFHHHSSSSLLLGGGGGGTDLNPLVAMVNMNQGIAGGSEDEQQQHHRDPRSSLLLQANDGSTFYSPSAPTASRLVSVISSHTSSPHTNTAVPPVPSNHQTLPVTPRIQNSYDMDSASTTNGPATISPPASASAALPPSPPTIIPLNENKRGGGGLRGPPIHTTRNVTQQQQQQFLQQQQQAQLAYMKEQEQQQFLKSYGTNFLTPPTTTCTSFNRRNSPRQSFGTINNMMPNERRNSRDTIMGSSSSSISNDNNILQSTQPPTNSSSVIYESPTSSLSSNGFASPDENVKNTDQNNLNSNNNSHHSKKSQSTNTQGGTTNKRKRRDPNEPPKPVSAYALFFRDTQAAIKGQNPTASFGEVSKIVASMWDTLEFERKEFYKTKTEIAKKDYLKKLAEYRAKVAAKNKCSGDGTGIVDDAISTVMTTNTNDPHAHTLQHKTRSTTQSIKPVNNDANASKNGSSKNSRRNMLPDTTTVGINENIVGVVVTPPAKGGSIDVDGNLSKPHLISEELTPLEREKAYIERFNATVARHANNDVNYSNMNPNICSNTGCTRSPLRYFYHNNQVEISVNDNNRDESSLSGQQTCQKDPMLDGMYCGNRCVVDHCKDIFNNWIITRKESSTFDNNGSSPPKIGNILHQLQTA